LCAAGRPYQKAWQRALTKGVKEGPYGGLYLEESSKNFI